MHYMHKSLFMFRLKSGILPPNTSHIIFIPTQSGIQLTINLFNTKTALAQNSIRHSGPWSMHYPSNKNNGYNLFLCASNEVFIYIQTSKYSCENKYN